MQKQVLNLTQELKQKSNLLDKVKGSKKGAPGMKPPMNVPLDDKDPKHASVKQFLDLKDEIQT